MENLERLAEAGTEELVRLIRRGDEIRNDISSSPTVRMLLERAEAEAEASRQLMAQVDPHDARMVALAQFGLRLHLAIRGWIAEVIEDGRAAEMTLLGRAAAEHGGADEEDD